MLRATLAALLLASALAADTWPFPATKEEGKTPQLLTLRSLNEKSAGASGYVKVDASGDFLLGNGDPVRFWAVNSDVGRDKPYKPRPRWPRAEPDLSRHARFLARIGVNMVRLHAHVNPDPKAGGKLTDINGAERDWIWRSVAACKKEGIYITLSPYFVLSTRLKKEWGVPAAPDAPPFGLLFFDETLQKGYRAWWRALLSEKNPYTGVPLAREPAIAILQLQNEDSLLFWTVNGLKGPARRGLGKKFAGWLAKQHGSLKKAVTRWGKDRLPGDDVAAGVLDFHNVYEMTQSRKGDRAVRLADQLRFWAETMRAFNAEMARFLREELGCQHLINANNWKTASSGRLGDVERWSYAVNDVLAVNRYFGGLHRGKNASWAVAAGDEFTRKSALLHPAELPINLRQLAGKPMLVTESGWVMPNGYAHEGPFLIAAYQSLTGVDAFYWFATRDETWSLPQSANGYLDSQAKWPIATPDTFGQFPACALLFRKGYVKRGRPAVEEHRSLDDLWQRRAPLVAEESGFDPNRDVGELPPSSGVKEVLPGAAFLVGPVVVHLGSDPAKSKAVNLAKYIDRKAKVVRSITGEITLDHGRGSCLLDSPCAQGVVGFFGKKESFTTRSATFTCKNEHAAVLAVSMDGLPLERSKKVLVQVGTNCRPAGWKETPAKVPVNKRVVEGFRLDSHGKAPWHLEKAEVRVEFRTRGLKRATILDPSGRARGEAEWKRRDGGVLLRFPPDALYVLLE